MIITLFILGASAIYMLYISILFLNFLIGFNWKKKATEPERTREKWDGENTENDLEKNIDDDGKSKRRGMSPWHRISLFSNIHLWIL